MSDVVKGINDSDKNNFLEGLKAARAGRAIEKKKEQSTIIVQSCVRRWLARRRIRSEVLLLFDQIFADAEPSLKPAIDVYKVARQFLYTCKEDVDQRRFELLCRYLVRTLDSDSKQINYIGLVMSKEYTVPWVAHIKQLLKICSAQLSILNPGRTGEMTTILVHLHTLVSFTGTSTWKLLNGKSEVVRTGMNIICNTIAEYLIREGLLINIKSLLKKGLSRDKISLKHAALSAAIRLSLIPVQSSQFSEKTLTMYLIQILSVPGLIHHLQEISPECIETFAKHGFLEKILQLLQSEQILRIVFNSLEGSYALCLLANIINLGYLESSTTLPKLFYPCFANLVSWFLKNCLHYVEKKQSNLTHWHPLLGWFSQKIDQHLQEAIPYVKIQLKLLWTSPMVNVILYSPLNELVEELKGQNYLSQPQTTKEQTGIAAAILRHVTDRKLPFPTNSSQPCLQLDDPRMKKITLLCSIYELALTIFSQLRMEILTALCYQDNMLYNIWQLLLCMGPTCGLKAFSELAISISSQVPKELCFLNLFCECMSHYVTVLDDMEMYEQQTPFQLKDYVAMTNFLNLFVYKFISQSEHWEGNSVFNSLYVLLSVLYRRDCRRRFTPTDHWLIKEIRVASLVNDLAKRKKWAQVLLNKMPHVISEHDRVKIFRKEITHEKSSSGLSDSWSMSSTATLITVHRTRIIEDGYRQLKQLSANALKGVVRVRFVNEQGLNEAGIDQDGVFKEFLEETVKCAFDPSLNLFKATSEQRLYPSPVSYLQDNHLQLLEFVGRMLGKAVYEGIVVDVPFAYFFLSHLLGNTQEQLYSAIDELPSLDAELYQSLTFIKHSQTDIRDLDLTFSVDEDCFGRLVTHELIPGGRAVYVTNENKISYVHLMAHFRMHTQIKEQTAAFKRGFHSIIEPELLGLFSAPELQRLISGDNVPVDLRSLRKHTQYYGGFHDSHRVIVWLWDILEKDFNEEEKGLFLKFVTSCSKPPLLGFAHLEPPFSIRCVEVSDDDDTGDTVASVIRGFFTIRRKDPQNRLPTASTCFNLLKLPNYTKKSTLRDKLRYAVTCNTGFELS